MNLGSFFRQNRCNPPKSLPNECEEYFLLVVTEAVSIATWANGSRHDFFWTWILPLFLGGGPCWWQIEARNAVFLWFLFGLDLSDVWSDVFVINMCVFLHEELNHISSLNSNSQWIFALSILIPGDVCCFLLEGHDKTNHVRECPPTNRRKSNTSLKQLLLMCLHLLANCISGAKPAILTQGM